MNDYRLPDESRDEIEIQPALPLFLSKTVRDGAVFWNFRTDKANRLILPVTDDWARDHLPQDELTQAMYTRLRADGAVPEEALGTMLSYWCPTCFAAPRTQEA